LENLVSAGSFPVEVNLHLLLPFYLLFDSIVTAATSIESACQQDTNKSYASVSLTYTQCHAFCGQNMLFLSHTLRWSITNAELWD